MRSALLLVTTALASSGLVRAGPLAFAPAFSDHMVLQAGRPIPIGGVAPPGAVVTVTLQSDRKSAHADATGHWTVQWPALAPTLADQGVALVADSGSDHTEIHDVLVGEVWLCSGQSNMRFTLGRNFVQPDPHSPQLFPGELAAARHPRLRLLNVSGGTPAGCRWAACSPDTVEQFSAIGYFFGQSLQPALADEPIGLIDLGRGGEPIRGFVSRETIAKNPALRNSLPPATPHRKDPTGEVFSEDLSRIAPFAVRGILWYQGESEVARARDYPAWMDALIQEWRRALQSPAAAFLIVQLPVYERHRTDPVPAHPGTHWAELRAAQQRVADTESGAALTPALDLGEEFEIHPHRKAQVGVRLARLAERHVYGQAVAADAPRVASVIPQGTGCVVTFENAEGGIVATDEHLANFECGLSDGRFVAAEARISGNQSVTVQFPPGASVTSLRYGWRDFFTPSLFNGEGLPVLPFSMAVLPVANFPSNPELPDPLVTADGRSLQARSDWPAQRAQVQAVVERYLTGHPPPQAGPIEAATVESQSLPNADYRRVRLRFGPQGSLALEIAVFLPREAKGARPTLIFLTPEGTPGSPPPDPEPPRYRSVSPAAFASARADALSRGYAVVAYYYQQGAADHDANRATGFLPAYPDADWGTLAAWAWSVSRVVDYLQSQPWADIRHLGVVGHSRLGKTALLAGAFDERIALTVAAGSGCGGTGAFRISGKARDGKEGLEEATRRFPYWFSPHLADFAGQVDRLPFDSNWVMDLVAPRALLDCEADSDPYCNGPAAAAAYRAAGQVYGFLGASDRLGWHHRPGGHALLDSDWSAILDFADRQFSNGRISVRHGKSGEE